MSDRFLSSRALESRLRAAHRRELERSPELRREFKRNRKTASSAFARGARHLLMPLFWAFIFYGTIQRQLDVQWAAGIVALWAAGTALKWGHEWFQQFYASDSLIVLNILPLNDRQIFQFQLRRYLAGAGWIAWELLLGYGVLCLVRSGQSPPIAAFVIAAIVQAALVLALALHAASYLHMLPLGTLAGLVRMTAIVLLILGVQGLEITKTLVTATEFFLPTGWTNYVLLQSSRDWSILALAVPIAAIIYLSRYSFARLRSYYSLEGFEILPGAPGSTGDDEDELTAAAAAFHRAGPTEIEDRVRARHFLEGVDWNLGGALEKFIARFLSPRERVVTEFLVAHDPGWTRSLKWSFWVWLIACVVVLSFGQFGGTIVFFAAYVLAAASLPVFGGEWKAMRQTPTGGVFLPGYCLYPVAFNEIARILLKVNLVRICAASPFVISFAALAAYKLQHSPTVGAIIGIKLVCVLVSVQPLFLLVPISSTTNATSRMTAIWFLIFAPVLLIMIAAIVSVFITGTFLGVVAACTVLLLLASLLFAVYRRAYRKGRFDLLSERTRNS
jgi:hypothetical protein